MASASVKGGLGHHHSGLGSVHDALASGGANSFDTVSGLGSGVSFDTVSAGSSGSGLGGHGPVQLAGSASVPTENVVATQVVAPGGVTLQFADGSSINIVGSSHIDSGFFGS